MKMLVAKRDMHHWQAEESLLIKRSVVAIDPGSRGQLEEAYGIGARMLILAVNDILRVNAKNRIGRDNYSLI